MSAGVQSMRPTNDLSLPPVPKSSESETARFPHWFPCDQPERPVDSNAYFHDCCTPCYLAAEASHRNGLLHVYGVGGARMVDVMQQRLDAYGEAPA